VHLLSTRFLIGSATTYPGHTVPAQECGEFGKIGLIGGHVPGPRSSFALPFQETGQPARRRAERFVDLLRPGQAYASAVRLQNERLDVIAVALGPQHRALLIVWSGRAGHLL
jgi:hypothetical protein